MRALAFTLVAVAACASGGASKPATQAADAPPARASAPATAPSSTPSPARVSRYNGPTIAPALQLDLSQMVEKPSGLFVRDLAMGSGIPAQTGDFVRVEYTLFLANGTRVESADASAPIEVRLGQHQIVAGWEEALTGMKNGGRRQIIVPPTLGYGMRTRGKVPGGSTLVFDMHVVYVGR